MTLFGFKLTANIALRGEVQRQTATAEAMLSELQKQVDDETKRAAAAEARVTILLRDAQTAPQTPVPRRASEVLKAAIERANQLMVQQKYAEALAEYLDCYRELRAARIGTGESQSLMSAMGSLGRRHPPALVALAELRDAALAEWRERSKREGLPLEIALLNERLDQGEQTIAVYDALPLTDTSGRQSLATIAQKSFVKARRYPDALLGRRFSQMMSGIEGMTRRPQGQDPEMQERVRKSVIDTARTDIEVLVGAEKTDEARQLAERLLTYEDSAATRAAIEQAKARALAPR